MTATAPKQQIKTHLVLAKETLFSIEKKYDVTDADLKKANPDLEKLRFADRSSFEYSFQKQSKNKYCCEEYSNLSYGIAKRNKIFYRKAIQYDRWRIRTKKS